MNAPQVSWLKLERYVLGELGADERLQVEAALTQSAQLRACLAQISNDAALVLRPLPLERRQVLSGWRGRRVGWAMAAAMAVAAGFLVLVRTPHQTQLEHLKGGRLALELIRSSANDPSEFVDADVFKARVTCSQQGPARWQLAVFQGKEVFFPLDDAEPIRCGNQVSLPGAFALTGTEAAIVCVAVAEAVVPRERLLREGIRALSASAVCTHVRPVSNNP